MWNSASPSTLLPNPLPAGLGRIDSGSRATWMTYVVPSQACGPAGRFRR